MDSRNLELEFRMRMKSHASEGLLQRPHPSLPFFSFVGSKILLQGSFEFLQKLSELGEALGSVNFSSLNYGMCIFPGDGTHGLCNFLCTLLLFFDVVSVLFLIVLGGRLFF